MDGNDKPQASQSGQEGTAPAPGSGSVDGGLGGHYRDLRLIARAIRQQWNIPPETRAKAMAVLEKAIDGYDEAPRNALVAVRTLVTANAQNMEQEKRDGGIPDRLEISGPGGEPVRVDHALLDRIRQRAALYEQGRTPPGDLRGDGPQEPVDSPPALP